LIRAESDNLDALIVFLGIFLAVATAVVVSKKKSKTNTQAAQKKGQMGKPIFFVRERFISNKSLILFDY
jgi:hypothetical protein